MIQVVAVGKLKAPVFRDGAADYVKRIQRFSRLRVHEIPDSNPSDEAKRLLAVNVTGPRVVCDLRGELWSSLDLSRHLGAHGATSFFLGGPDGLADELVSSADHVMKMSGFTLPHELARLVLLEQIYRGFTILRGHPYHR